MGVHVRPPSAERRTCEAAEKPLWHPEVWRACEPVRRSDSGVAGPGWCVRAQNASSVVLPEKLQPAYDQVVQYGINYPLECTDRLTDWLVGVC